MEGISQPWRYDLATESQFLNQADTGDVLLLKSCGGQGPLRNCLIGEFDHIGLLLKFESDPDDVYMLEAAVNDKVKLTRWSEIRP